LAVEASLAGCAHHLAAQITGYADWPPGEHQRPRTAGTNTASPSPFTWSKTMRTTIAAAAITAAASTAILTGCGNSAAEHAAQVKACTAAMTALIKHNYASVPEEPAACRAYPTRR
jgi:hypothetical protein